MAHSFEDKGREVKHHMREGKTNAQSRKIKKYNEKSDESSHVDLAPMVDIAFLLLTFFMMTTSFSKPNVFQIGLPEDSKGGGKGVEVNQLYVLTIQISRSGNIYMHRGIESDQNRPILVAFDQIEKQARSFRKSVLDDPLNSTKSPCVQ
jgi:biopolymer transport protein ExbD